MRVPFFPFPSVFAAAAVVGAGGLFGAERPDGRALVEKYCFECHGDGSRKGDLALDALLEADGAEEASRSGWRKAWKITRHEFMPPAGAERPSDGERLALTRWIEAGRLGVDHGRADPGRVTMRRLNRMEYEFSVTDLFGAEVATEREFSADEAVTRLRLRDRLPPDDTAYGFDNIGDFQTLSPALLEKYVELAEDIVGRVIAVEGPSFPSRALVGPPDTRREEEPRRVTQGVGFEVAHGGPYEIHVRFSLGGWDEFGGAYDFSFQADETEFTRDTLEVGGQKTHLYTGAIALAPGPHQIRLVTTALRPDFEGRMRHLELRPDIRLIGPKDPALAAYPESHRRIFFDGKAPPDPEARRAYAREIRRRLADRAFRRPADAGTLDRLTASALSDSHFECGVAQAVTGILASPRFLFRAESQPQPNDPAAIHPLDEFALASRLSYLLWLSLPDEELTRLAGEGRLRENLRAQVARLLADPKSARFFEDFPGQWLRTRNVLMTPISREAACHAHFDPIGIVLEHYDLIGRWRDEEKGAPFVARETTVTGETLEGLGDLRDLFTARKEMFYRCVTEKLLTYALGRGLEPFDAATVDRIAAEVAADGGKFSTLLMAVVESPAFQTRRGDDGRTLDSPNAGIPEPPPPELRKGPRRLRPETPQPEPDPPQRSDVESKPEKQ